MLTGDALLAKVKELRVCEPTKPVSQEQSIARTQRIEKMTKSTTFAEVAEWIRKTHLECYRYNDVGLWHRRYKRMNTINDIIRILKQKDQEND